MMTTTRSYLATAWAEAQQYVDTNGAIKLTAAALAGYALAQSGGEPHRARGLVPMATTGYYARVRSYLDSVEIEERAGICRRHDYRDGDVCSRCDTVRPVRALCTTGASC